MLHIRGRFESSCSSGGVIFFSGKTESSSKKMRWTILGETHGEEEDRLWAAVTKASSHETIVFLEALPVGAFIDDERAWRVASNFSSASPEENLYLRLARACRQKGISVYGLERAAHRIPSCFLHGLRNRVQCAVHRACLPSKKRCIEADWVDDIWQCDELTRSSHLLIIVGRLHESHLRKRLTARALLHSIFGSEPAACFSCRQGCRGTCSRRTTAAEIGLLSTR